jgi:hypothetical protein
VMASTSCVRSALDSNSSNRFAWGSIGTISGPGPRCRKHPPTTAAILRWRKRRRRDPGPARNRCAAGCTVHPP